MSSRRRRCASSAKKSERVPGRAASSGLGAAFRRSAALSMATATSIDAESRVSVSPTCRTTSRTVPVCPTVALVVKTTFTVVEAWGLTFALSVAGVQPLAMPLPVHVRVYRSHAVSVPAFARANAAVSVWEGSSSSDS